MFEHSIKVPRLYKTAAKIARDVKEKNIAIKNVVYEQKCQNIKAIYALVVTVFKHYRQLEFLLKKSKILEKEPRLDPWLAKILITELLWGKRRLSSESKPVKTVLAYQQIFNAHFSDVTDSLGEIKTVSKPRYVRVNTLCISVNEVVEGFRDEGWTFVRYMVSNDYSGFLERVANLRPEEFMVDIHIKELLIFPPNTQFYNHSAYRDGLILLQDKASCLPVHLLDAKPGSLVLDMCAAPGMKTSHIACRLENKGKIYAVDVDYKRLNIVDELMKKCGITCVTTINKDVLTIKDRDCPDVEYILVDPSCSGSGMVDRLDLTEKKEVDEHRIKKLFGFQVMILKHAFRHFPKVKRVVYSTCSLHIEENEMVVQEVIENCSAFRLIDAKQLMPNWHNFGSEKFGKIGKSCLYSRPEQDNTNGFFVAVFERLKNDEINEFLNPQKTNDHRKHKLDETNSGINENSEANKQKRKKRNKKTKLHQSLQGTNEVLDNNTKQIEDLKNNENDDFVENKSKKVKDNKQEYVSSEMIIIKQETTEASLRDKEFRSENLYNQYKTLQKENHNKLIDKTHKKRKHSKKESDFGTNLTKDNNKSKSIELLQEEPSVIQKKHKRMEDSTELQHKDDTQLSTTKKKDKKKRRLSLFEEMCDEPQKVKNSENSIVIEEQFQKDLEESKLNEDSLKKKKKHNTKDNSQNIFPTNHEIQEQQYQRYRNNSNIEGKGKPKLDKSFILDVILSNEEKETIQNKDYLKKKKKCKAETNLNASDIDVREKTKDNMNDSIQKFETCQGISESKEERERRKQLNEDNSLVRAGLSDFLQTLSS